MGWFVLNQLLGTFGSDLTVIRQKHTRADEQPTKEKAPNRAALVEVGGGSAQVVVEVDTNVSAATEQLDFCGSVYSLYSKSYDGLGRQLALEGLVHTLSKGRQQENDSHTVSCLQRGASMTLVQGSTYTAEGQPNFDTCRQDVDHFVLSSIDPLPFVLPPHTEIYAVENYYYFNKYVRKDDSNMFTIADFDQLAEQLCANLSVDEVAIRIHPEAEREKAETACFGLNFLSLLLTRVLRLPPEHKMHAVLDIANSSIAWPAGVVALTLPKIYRDVLHAAKIRDEL